MSWFRSFSSPTGLRRLLSVDILMLMPSSFLRNIYISSVSYQEGNKLNILSFWMKSRVQPALQLKCLSISCLRSSSAWPSRSSGLCSRLSGCSRGSVLSRVQASNPDCREALWRTQQASRMDELLSGEYCRYPLVPSKHLNLVWMALKVLSTISCVSVCARLYRNSAGDSGQSTGVINHFLRG